VAVGLGKMLLFLIAIHGFAPGNKKPRLSRGFKSQQRRKPLARRHRDG
jgi:hypothetical protein